MSQEEEAPGNAQWAAGIGAPEILGRSTVSASWVGRENEGVACAGDMRLIDS